MIQHDKGLPKISWPPNMLKVKGIIQREEVADENLIPYFHFPYEFAWDLRVSYTLPKGYSAIITHPLNRHDLPFTTITGIIDSGIVMAPHGNIPFYLKKNFTGIIPQGTPVAQIIPFLRENWNSEKTEGLVEIGKHHNSSSAMLFSGWYKKTFWTKKEYN